MEKSLKQRCDAVLLRALAFLYLRVGKKNIVVVLGVFVGIVTGLASAALKYMVGLLHALHGLLAEGGVAWLLALLPLLGVAMAYVIQRLIVGNAPYDRSLSSLIRILGQNQPNMPFHKTFSHLLTSGFCVGLGGSAGLEAPIVLTGAAIGSNGAKVFRLDKNQKTLLLGCGAAAGISAIFDSPVAGVLFVAEVLLPEFSVSALVPVLLATASSAVVSKLLHGQQLFLLGTAEWSMEALPFYFALGGVCALVGVYMIESSYAVSGWIRSWLKGDLTRLCVGGLLLSGLIFLMPPLFGEGYSFVEALFDGDWGAVTSGSPLASFITPHSWTLLLFCVAVIFAKVVATALTVESGGDGGIFAPAMLAGAFTGFVFARGMNMTGAFALSEPNFVAAGMCGVFTAVLRAPMTGIFLIAEVTGGYMLFIPLMIVAAIAYFVARLFEPYSVYTKILAAQKLLFHEDKDGAILSRIRVGTLVERDFSPVCETDSFRRLVEVLTTTHRNLFPVLDANGKLSGVVHMDLIRGMLLDTELYDTLLVYDIMAEPSGTLTEDDNLTKAMLYFDLFNLWNLPVITADGKYLGFISKSGVFAQYRGLVKQAPAF